MRKVLRLLKTKPLGGLSPGNNGIDGLSFLETLLEWQCPISISHA